MTLDEIEYQHYTMARPEVLFPEVEKFYASTLAGTSERGRCAFLMGAYHEGTQYAKAKLYYNESYEIARKLSNKKILSDALHGIAVDAFMTGDLRAVTRLEHESLDLAIKTNHHYRIAFSEFMLSIVASLYGEFENCSEYLHQSLEIARIEGFQKLQIRLLSKLSELYLNSRDFLKSRKLIQQCIAVASAIPSERDIIDSNIRLATIELEFKKYGEVIKLITKVRKTLSKENHSLWCVTHTLMGKVHEAKRRYDKAEKEFRTALTLADYANAERVRSNVHTHLAELFLKTKKPKPALKEAIAALADAEKAQDAFVRKEALRCVHDCYKSLGKYREAHEYLEKHNTLVAKGDADLLKSRLEYHTLKSDYEREKAMSNEKTRQSELLRISLEYKERELTEKTRHLIKQTDALAQFRDDLRALIRRSPSGDPLVAEIRERLNSFPESELNWKEFDKQFQEVHPEFLHDLAARFPKLTPMEKKVCALLRLNLTSSDIARLLFLSDRNIENHRYRIRGKLGLDTRESLHEFLGAI